MGVVEDTGFRKCCNAAPDPTPFTIDHNHFRGKTTLQIMIQDVVVAEE